MAKTHLSRRAILLGFVLGLAAGSFATLLLRNGSSAHLVDPADPSDHMAELALDHVLPEVWLEHVPLHEAAAKISQLSGVPIEIDNKALSDAGISPAMPVTVRLRNAKLASVMEELTRPTNNRDVLSWNAQRQSLRIATDGTDPGCVVRIYDINEFLGDAKPTYANDDPAIMHAESRQVRIPIEYAGQELAIEEITKLVQETVAPDTWRESGGSIGRIHELSGRLIVTQTIRNHRAIRMLLAQLRNGVNSTALPPPTPEPRTLRWQDTVQQWVPTDSSVAELKLRTIVPQFRVDQQTPAEALAQIARQWDAPATLAPSVERTLPKGMKISFALRNVTGYDALHAMLQAIALTQDPGDDSTFVAALFWGVDGGLILVAPREDIPQELLVTRSYDLKDWLGRDAALGMRREELAEQVERFISESIAPPPGLELTSVRGIAAVFGDRVVVTQTWENQERIRRMINQLHDAVRTAQPSKEPSATQPGIVQ